MSDALTPPAGEARSINSTVTLLASAAFFSGASLRLCDALLPRLAADFSITPGQAGQVVIGFSIGYGLSQLLFGPLGDRYGKTRLMRIAMFGCSAFAVAAALAPSFEVLVWTRVVWGMAAAGVIPLAMAWIGDNVPYAQRQATLARFLTGTLSGMTAGQLAGGLFADAAAGWRGAFLAVAAGFLCVATLFAMRVPHVPLPSRVEGEPHASFASQPMAVVRTPWARVVLLAVLAEGTFLLGPMSYLPSYLHARQGVSLTLASAMLALYAVGGLAYALTARRIVSRFGERRMALCGGLLMGAAYFALWLAPPWVFVAPIALSLGFGTYLFHNTLQTHATQMLPALRGTSVALFSFCLFIGQAIGTTAAGWSIDRIGYAPMLLTAAIGTALSGWGFASALRRRARQSES